MNNKQTTQADLHKPTLGILGGVGPLATARLMGLIVENTAVTSDQEHINVLVYNHSTLPDRTAFLLNPDKAEDPRPYLRADAQFLEGAGCDFLAIPCNTAHAFFSDIASAVSIPLLNMVELTVQEAVAKGVAKLGILATAGTVHADTYGKACRAHGLDYAYPNKDIQQQVNSVIYDYVKAGRKVPANLVQSLYDSMFEVGCDSVALGCTELSIAHDEACLKRGSEVIDSELVLARACVIHAGKQTTES